VMTKVTMLPTMPAIWTSRRCWKGHCWIASARRWIASAACRSWAGQAGVELGLREDGEEAEQAALVILEAVVQRRHDVVDPRTQPLQQRRGIGRALPGGRADELQGQRRATDLADELPGCVRVVVHERRSGHKSQQGQGLGLLERRKPEGGEMGQFGWHRTHGEQCRAIDAERLQQPHLVDRADVVQHHEHASGGQPPGRVTGGRCELGAQNGSSVCHL
jgi:hypothetical protein